MAFSQRILKFQFQLGKGDFGTAGADTVDLSGYRASVNIVKSGYSMAQADVRIWGLPLDLMNKLTVLNKLGMGEFRSNTITIMAGDEDSGVAACFKGNVFEAWADGRDPPDVLFHVSAFTSFFDSTTIIPPTSYKGSVDAAFVLSGIAAQIGYGFVNSGVTAKISNPYYPGNVKAQIASVCEAANCLYDYNEAERILYVWPKDKSRDGLVVKVSPDAGMIGYPSFSQNGIQFATIYNPNLTFGRAIIMESQFKPANGQWVVMSLAHQLDALVPNGMWITDVECGFLGHTA
jgi:hypothetical protein